MTKETKHLIFWWFEWLKRLVRTTYHIFNRSAYHKWKFRQQSKYWSNSTIFDAINMAFEDVIKDE